MTGDEVRAFLDDHKVMQCATVGSDGRPHMVPLWYVVDDGPELRGWTYAKSQKAVNLRRDPKVTCLVEAGEAYNELRGVQIKGHAILIDELDAVLRLGETIWERYAGGPLNDAMRQMVAAQARKRIGVIVEPIEVATWDHRKLGGAY